MSDDRVSTTGGVRDIDLSLDRHPPARDLAALVERHRLVSREPAVTPVGSRSEPVFVVKFRPGGFLPFLGSPIADLTARPVETLWAPPPPRSPRG